VARYPLNLPVQLKKEAEQWAASQGVSLNQFVMWAVAEKVGALRQHLDDPAFPRITYRRGAAGVPTPVLRGTGIRVQTIVVAARQWELTPEQVADEYGLTESQVQEALAFYTAHQAEIDATIETEQRLQQETSKMPTPIQLTTTTETKADARTIADALVERRLAACVQIIGPITSTYRWQGKVETAEEWLCVIKSRHDLYDALEAAILELHPYDVPEILITPVTGGSQSYLDWLDGELRTS
jgi:uncharacterized protein involved in tolerance to divalent cations/uncharacterized protein (DUF433 family)